MLSAKRPKVLTVTKYGTGVEKESLYVVTHYNDDLLVYIFYNIFSKNNCIK